MKVSLIAAVAENGVIGRDNGLPWRLPEDLQYFKRVTLGKPIIMGRKTFESIGRALPGRVNIVISRHPATSSDNLRWVDSPDAALLLARQLGADEAMIIGGEAIYRALLPGATRLYITEVHAAIEGDAFFPHYDPDDWCEVQRSAADPDSSASHLFSFVVMERNG
jgi:dihydrofolate reductase